MNAHHTITVFVASLVNPSLREDVMIHLRRQSSRRWQLVLLKRHTNVTYWGIEISTLCHFYCYSPRLCHRCNFDRSAMSSNPYLICEVSYLIFPSIATVTFLSRILIPYNIAILYCLSIPLLASTPRTKRKRYIGDRVHSSFKNFR